MHVDDIEIKR
jgi:tRNA(Ile)-lysidine synthase TilS/MesJ